MADQPPDGYGVTANSQAETWELARSREPLPSRDGHPDPGEPPRETGSAPPSELLDAVLKETISLFSDEDADRWFAGWRKANVSPPLNTETLTKLVGDLLHKQFQGWRCPEPDRQAIARWLWEDPIARQKLESLWTRRGGEQP